jgi:hypothetical protein
VAGAAVPPALDDPELIPVAGDAAAADDVLAGAAVDEEVLPLLLVPAWAPVVLPFAPVVPAPVPVLGEASGVALVELLEELVEVLAVEEVSAGRVALAASDGR